MSGSRHSKFPSLILGELPVSDINRTLGTDIETGKVVFTKAAQAHAARRHPVEYPVLMPHVAAIVAAPLYVGDDFHNNGKIELVGTAQGLEGFALVAISLDRDIDGNYSIASIYPVSRDKIEGRKQRGFLKVLLKE